MGDGAEYGVVPCADVKVHKVEVRDAAGPEKNEEKRANGGHQLNALRRYEQFLTTTALRDNDEAQAVYQVHEDLRLVRKWAHLRVLSHTRPAITGVAPAHLDAVFPRGKPHIDRTRVVLPLSSDTPMTVGELHALCQRAAKGEHRCVTLALVDDDSTTAYYRAFTDWKEIVHPQWKMKKEKGEDDDADDEDSTQDDDDDDNDDDDAMVDIE